MNKLPAPVDKLLILVTDGGKHVHGYNRSNILGPDQYRDVRGNPIYPVGWLEFEPLPGI